MVVLNFFSRLEYLCIKKEINYCNIFLCYVNLDLIKLLYWRHVWMYRKYFIEYCCFSIRLYLKIIEIIPRIQTSLRIFNIKYINKKIWSLSLYLYSFSDVVNFSKIPTQRLVTNEFETLHTSRLEWIIFFHQNKNNRNLPKKRVILIKLPYLYYRT